MLNIVEEVLPFGSEQWQNVASRFSTNIPGRWTERDLLLTVFLIQGMVCVPRRCSEQNVFNTLLNLQSLATPPVSANMSITTSIPLHATARASRALQNAWEKVAEVTICRLSQPNGTSSHQAGPTDSQHRKRHACGQKIVEPGKSNGSDADDDGRAPRRSGGAISQRAVTNENRQTSK
ncbi:hypothetical protein JG688_00018553 [Phytophthora aleatoria]|uniref:Uncharacterized protein n=1 Tax=Phytophthora aleatoria TaxID=2496075 RepID=A0A8J5I8J1_9STRA|nr:hypothetical protein JG688_00018553 [Phytophthora aleatoria]